MLLFNGIDLKLSLYNNLHLQFIFFNLFFLLSSTSSPHFTIIISFLCDFPSKYVNFLLRYEEDTLRQPWQTSWQRQWVGC
jgi:hypothetical protein